MSLLGLDSATRESVACVLRSDGSAFEGAAPRPADGSAGPGHARELLPAALDALRAAGLTVGELDAVAVGVGPGAFTGLRVGIATARGLVRGAGLELRPVSSLAVLAAGIEAPLALALIEAGKGELFAAVFQDGEEVVPAFAATPEAIGARLAAEGLNPLAVGGGSVRFSERLEAAGVLLAPPDSPCHRITGDGVCRVGSSAASAAPEAVLPNYLREPDAKPR